MVCYSNKQVILTDIVCTLKLSIPAEVIQNTDRVQHSCSTDINNLDDDGDPILLSRHLVCLYTFICKQRYTITHCTPLGCADKLIHLLNRYESSNHRMYHGLVHMSPEAFNNLAIRLQQTEAFWWNYSSSGVMSLNKVQEILSVALYRLGHSGNGGGEHDAALQCGCGVGSIVGYTNHTVAGLLELNNEVMQFASEGERQHASAWVHNTTGVEEWGKGWLVVDGTHIPLAWKPGVLSQEHFCYKGFPSINVALVILPHSLRIVKSVVGQPGSVQDSKVWASGSNILKKPHLYLDEGYCGNIYHFKDHITAAEMIQACIVAHTFASQYDRPADIANLLLPSFSEDEVLFRSTGCNEEDTTALSRRHERTTVDYIAMTQSASAQRQEQVLTQPFSI
ncbi:uncharacterized protein UHO2_07408 [Ustilago hordei]|uniref:uncharacterized protein n=1 Tax=Ustilago hordei TaxID=120017 RepID=UPI001A60DF88|nr:uncharacterized protein UHO2_07408 [Ustilago hordei]SYW81329.1 uncharacterized protein UHO2_07408 [Ustilago hordei]